MTVGTTARFVRLPERGVVSVGGPDRIAFLQGLVTNDVTRLSPARALYAALLTPQGAFLHEFFLATDGARVLIDCEAARRDDLVTRLSRFRLRSKVEIGDETACLAVGAVIGASHGGSDAIAAGDARQVDGAVVFVDPRRADLGERLIAPEGALARIAGCPETDHGAYDRLRLGLGVPDGSRDIPVGKGLPLEYGFDDLNAIAWDKGCYVGQELTARTRYRANIRKRLFPVAVEGPLPPPGTPIAFGGADAGEARTGNGTLALALLKLAAVKAQAERGGRFSAGAATLTIVSGRRASEP